MKRRISLLAAFAAALALVALAAFAAVTMASPASGVTGTPLARGTYAPFDLKSERPRPSDSEDRQNHEDRTAAVRSDPQSPINFTARAKTPIDLVIQKHDYQPGATTGWHSHPGPVFITVTQGQLTFYEADDPTCSPHVVSAGQGYVDTGHGHIGRNETNQLAQDVTVAVAPVGGAFRSELNAPGPYCSF